MHKMEELKDMLCEELDRITKKGELSAGSLDAIDKLTHSIKSIDTIIAMEDAGYSNASRGRYSRDDYAYENRNSYASRRIGGYSRDNAKEDLMEQLHELKAHAKDDRTREMIHKWIKQAEMD